MTTLKESLESFIAPVYSKTKRTADTYNTVSAYCAKGIEQKVEEYYQVENDQQWLREIRNDIDNYLRRHDKYCIEQRAGVNAHYYEVGHDEETDFEHLIPAAVKRELLLQKKITIEQAFNTPTVTLSRAKHKALHEAGWASKTPSLYYPFKRYECLGIQIRTYDELDIDQTNWTLDDHYNHFKHLVI